MGVDLQTYRCRIGSFRFNTGVDVATLYVFINFSGSFRTIGSLVFIGLLLLMAGIESNPGPGNAETKLLVTALPKDTAKECIEKLFGVIVQKERIVTNVEVNTSDCSAVVEFDSQKGASFLLKQSQSCKLNGHELKVDPFSATDAKSCENAPSDLDSESTATDRTIFCRFHN